MQFPVSSGQHHRANESEWVPVPPPTKKPVKRNFTNSQSYLDNLHEFRDFVAASKPDKLTANTTTSAATPSTVTPVSTSNTQEDVATPNAIEPAIEVNIFKDQTTGKVILFF